MIFLGTSALVACATVSRAEVEPEWVTLYSDTSKVEIPLLISLHDQDGIPVEGAVVVLKRLGPDGWTEEAIVREADKRTDKNGMILLIYPRTFTRNSWGQDSIDIYGAVTVVADERRTVTIELRDYFKDGKYVLSESTATHLKLEVGDRTEGSAKQPSQAPPDGAKQPPTARESEVEGEENPKPESDAAPPVAVGRPSRFCKKPDFDSII
jgi:hypothetical protein